MRSKAAAVLREDNRANSSDAGAGPATLAAGKAVGRNVPAYTDAALAANQPPVTALIPQRPLTVAVFLLTPLGIISGLLAAYGNLYLWPPALRPFEMSALDLALPGGLAAWFSSLLVLAAACQSVQIYRLRRHRVDDYRGRYRVWIWVPGVLVIMAIGAATRLPEDLIRLGSTLCGVEPGAEWHHLGRLGYAVAWALISLRLGFEMRRNWPAVAWLAVSVACFFAGVAFRQLVFPPLGEVLQGLAWAAPLLFGHAAVLFALTLYARYVYRAAQGQLAVPARLRSGARPRPVNPPKTQRQRKARSRRTRWPSRRANTQQEVLPIRAEIRRPSPDAGGHPSSAVSPMKAGDASRQPVRTAPPKPQRPEPDVQDDEDADGNSDGMSDDGDQDQSRAERRRHGSSNAANNDALPSPSVEPGSGYRSASPGKNRGSSPLPNRCQTV